MYEYVREWNKLAELVKNGNVRQVGKTDEVKDDDGIFQMTLSVYLCLLLLRLRNL
jgi:hypothetical protein